MTKSYCPWIRRNYIFLALHSDNTFETLEIETFGDCVLNQVENKTKTKKSLFCIKLTFSKLLIASI